MARPLTVPSDDEDIDCLEGLDLVDGRGVVAIGQLEDSPLQPFLQALAKEALPHRGVAESLELASHQHAGRSPRQPIV